LALFEAQAQSCNLHTEIEGDDAEVRGSEAVARMVHVCAETMSEAGGELVRALALLAQKIKRATKATAAREFVDAADKDEDAVTHLLIQSAAKIGDVLIEFAARLHHELGGSRGRGGADIGDKIGYGEIGFVADAGDYGDFGGGDGAGNFFFVEGPEIFEGAAAAGQNEHVYHFSAIEELQGADDVRGCAIALYAHRIECQVHIAKAAAQYADYVADGCTAR
jgi:hypothetical protein